MVGQVTGPVVVGLVKDSISTRWAFWTAAIFFLLATGLFVAVYARGTRVDSSTPTSGD